MVHLHASILDAGASKYSACLACPAATYGGSSGTLQDDSFANISEISFVVRAVWLVSVFLKGRADASVCNTVLNENLCFHMMFILDRAFCNFCYIGPNEQHHINSYFLIHCLAIF